MSLEGDVYLKSSPVEEAREEGSRVTETRRQDAPSPRQYDPGPIKKAKEELREYWSQGVDAPWRKDAISEQLLYLLQRAIHIRENYKSPSSDFKISFRSLLLAFLSSNDKFSRWFQIYRKRVSIISVQKILEERGVDPNNFRKIQECKSTKY